MKGDMKVEYIKPEMEIIELDEINTVMDSNNDDTPII